MLEDFASDYFANKMQLDINLRTFTCFHLFLQNGFPGGSVVKKKKKKISLQCRKHGFSAWVREEGINGLNRAGYGGSKCVFWGVKWSQGDYCHEHSSLEKYD